MADEEEGRPLLGTRDYGDGDSGDHETNHREMDYEDLWFDPELFAHVHSHTGNPVAGHYVWVCVNDEPVERWITALGRDNAGYEIQAGNDVIRFQFRCLDDENMLRLFTYWEDILRERASQDAVAEQTSATENIVPENTIPRNISTDSTITDNTITECTTENSSIENPTEETDEVATTDMNNDGEDTAIKAPGGRNALEVVKHFFFQPLRLPPMPRGLDLTRRAGRNQFSFWILHVVFSVIYWVVMNLYSIYHMLLFLLIIADAFGCEGAGRLLKELTFGWLPIAWLGWARSDEGKAAEQEYTAAHDRVRAEYNEQVRQLRLQREARRMAWTG